MIPLPKVHPFADGCSESRDILECLTPALTDFHEIPECRRTGDQRVAPGNGSATSPVQPRSLIKRDEGGVLLHGVRSTYKQRGHR